MNPPKFITDDTSGHDPLIIRVTADMLTDNYIPVLWKDLIRAYMSLSPDNNALFCTGLRTIRRGLRIIRRAIERYADAYWDHSMSDDSLPDWFVELLDEIPTEEDRQDDDDYGYAEIASLLKPIIYSNQYTEQERLKASLIIDLWEYPEFEGYVAATLDRIDKYLEENQ